MYKKSNITEGQIMNYQKKSDKNIIPEIQKVIQIRPSYGYKRVTAMINKQRENEDKSKLNKKRIYRIMKQNSLLLPKQEKQRIREGTGKVMTLHSNTRWCSDAFEIKCFNAEKVYVAFSLDCRDREIISYVAQNRPLINEDIQYLMYESVEKRFKSSRLPRQIEWLTDRGLIYRAQKVQECARKLGLKTCYTAPYSPSSNGMAEAFVGSFKRDYVYVNDCYSSDSVIKMLQEWIKDYNENAPHSALGYKSPVEFRKTMV